MINQNETMETNIEDHDNNIDNDKKDETDLMNKTILDLKTTNYSDYNYDESKKLVDTNYFDSNGSSYVEFLRTKQKFFEQEKNKASLLGECKGPISLINYNPYLKQCNINSPRSIRAAKLLGYSLNDILIPDFKEWISTRLNLSKKEVDMYYKHAIHLQKTKLKKMQDKRYEIIEDEQRFNYASMQSNSPSKFNKTMGPIVDSIFDQDKSVHDKTQGLSSNRSDMTADKLVEIEHKIKTKQEQEIMKLIEQTLINKKRHERVFDPTKMYEYKNKYAHPRSISNNINKNDGSNDNHEFSITKKLDRGEYIKQTAIQMSKHREELEQKRLQSEERHSLRLKQIQEQRQQKINEAQELAKEKFNKVQEKHIKKEIDIEKRKMELIEKTRVEEEKKMVMQSVNQKYQEGFAINSQRKQQTFLNYLHTMRHQEQTNLQKYIEREKNNEKYKEHIANQNAEYIKYKQNKEMEIKKQIELNNLKNCQMENERIKSIIEKRTHKDQIIEQEFKKNREEKIIETKIKKNFKLTEVKDNAKQLQNLEKFYREQLENKIRYDEKRVEQNLLKIKAEKLQAIELEKKLKQEKADLINQYHYVKLTGMVPDKLTQRLGEETVNKVMYEIKHQNKLRYSLTPTYFSKLHPNNNNYEAITDRSVKSNNDSFRNNNNNNSIKEYSKTDNFPNINQKNNYYDKNMKYENKNYTVKDNKNNSNSPNKNDTKSKSIVMKTETSDTTDYMDSTPLLNGSKNKITFSNLDNNLSSKTTYRSKSVRPVQKQNQTMNIETEKSNYLKNKKNEMRIKHKEEMLELIEYEYKLEEAREQLIDECAGEKERSRLQKIFGQYRAIAQTKLENLTNKHQIELRRGYFLKNR